MVSRTSLLDEPAVAPGGWHFALRSSLLKKASIHSVHETRVLEAAVFLQELALAKPVAHDEFAFDQLFNGLLEEGRGVRLAPRDDATRTRFP